MVVLNTIECCDALEYLKKIPDNFVDLVVTDPPYNVSQDKDLKFNGRIIKKNFGDWDRGFDPVPILRELKRVLKPNGQIYVFCGTLQIPIYMKIFEEEWYFRQLIVWYKTNPAPRMNKNNFVFANEYIIYAINEKVKTNEITFNFGKQTEMHNTIITPTLQGKERLRGPDGFALHPTQKPLSILKKLIQISSKPGDVLVLQEWDPETQRYTGREIEKTVTYAWRTRGQSFWPKEEVEKFGFQILSFK